jgi:hypothetical protein
MSSIPTARRFPWENPLHPTARGAVAPASLPVLWDRQQFCVLFARIRTALDLEER